MRDDQTTPGASADRSASEAERQKRAHAKGAGSLQEEVGGGTYRTLDEESGRISPTEERFERGRRTLGLFLGPIVFLVVLLAPLGLEPVQHRLAAILAFVVVWWITEAIPIPVTSILGIALCVVLEAVPLEEGDTAAEVVFSSFTTDTIFLFIGGFILAEAMVVHGLHRRFAYWVLASRMVGGSTFRIILAFGLIGGITSPVMSNTAAAAMLLPIAIGVTGTIGRMIADQAEGDLDPRRLRFGTALMLVITYGITVGGLLLPIGSPPNLIGRNLLQEATGEPITFLEWFITTLPIVVIMFAAMILVIMLLNRPEVKEVRGMQSYVADQRRELGPMDRGERNTIGVLALAIFFWFLPGLVGLVAGDDSPIFQQVTARVTEGVVAIIAAVLLFLLPVDWNARRFTLNWSQAARIDWGTILLFGAGITLGSLLSRSGLAQVVGESLSSSLGVSSLIGITILIVIVSVIISETTSNTASAAIVVPIAVSLSAAVGVDPTIPGLAAIFGANYGFMLPVSTPPNAIVYSSGMLPITSMLRAGIVFDVIGAVLSIVGVIVMANVVGLV